MKNIANRFCPKCGTAIAPGSLQGLCPNCLALVAFGSDPGSEQTVVAPTAGETSEKPVAPQPAAKPLITSTMPYFGDYELLEEIARGGMGVVYKARQRSLNRIVAVKMILGGQFTTEADVKRFRTEAEAAANLKHPNIVAIHETGEHEGKHYFSMDYVEGKNLAQVIGGEPLPAQKAATLLKTIADAVHYAHQRGTLHRDLKPHNVMIDADGQPHITDFGLAKLVEQQSDLTQTGAVMGSPSYMPPEQAAGKNDLAGPASDVYSIGAMLYHLLTGRAPFAAETPVATLRKVMEEEPIAPSKLNARTPSDLEIICLKCLEKKPERRYATARALAEELGRFLNHEPILARRTNPVRRGWSWLIRHPWIVSGIGSLMLLFTIGFAYWMWERVDAVEWRQVHPTQNPLFNSGYFFPAWFNYFLFIEFFFLQVIPMSWFMQLRGRKQHGNWFYYVFGLAGAVQLLFGLEILRRVVATQAWEAIRLDHVPLLLDVIRQFFTDLAWQPKFIIGSIAALIVALTNVWFGSALAWKALREARLDLPGVNATEEQIEHPLEFAKQNLIWKAFIYEVGGGIGLCLTMVGNIEPLLGRMFGTFGMCGVTGLVLINRLIAHSSGLERQLRLPLLMVVLAFAASGLLGVTKSTWHEPLILSISGFIVGKLLLRWCPLQRAGVPIQLTQRTGPARSRVFIRWLWRVFWQKRTAYATALGVALLALFYLVENWRGMRAWDQAKARLEARGEQVDWAAFVPKTRVPDDQNVFKHPFIQKYCINKGWNGNTNALKMLDPGFIGHGLDAYTPIPLATLKQLPRQTVKPVTLQSLNPKLADGENGTVKPTDAPLNPKPAEDEDNIILFKNIPLKDAVNGLARMAEIKVVFDANRAPFVESGSRWVGPAQSAPVPSPGLLDAPKQRVMQAVNWLWDDNASGPGQPDGSGWVWSSVPHQISVRMENVTEAQALNEIVINNGLEWEFDAANGTYRFKPVYTSLAELMTRLTRDDVQLRQLEEALQRPQAQLDWNLETSPLELLVPNFALLRSLAQGLSTRCKVHLLQGHPDAALHDLVLIKRIGDISAARPSLVGTMVKATIDGLRAECAQEGLTAGLWPATHMAAVQKEFVEADLLTPFSTALRWERASEIEFIRRLASPWKYPNAGSEYTRMFCAGFLKLSEKRFGLALRVLPRGWFYQNMTQLVQAPDSTTTVDSAGQRVDSSKAKDISDWADEWLRGSSAYNTLAIRATPNFVKALKAITKQQTLVNEAFVACALERHRATKGSYPDTLAALVPTFAAKLPHDIFDGQPLRYHRTDDGKYLLYSIGWNSKDDGGTPAFDQNPTGWSTEHGDWLWRGAPAK